MATSQRDMKEILRRLLAEMDDEDALSELDELKQRLEQGFTVTPAMIRTAIDEAEPAERDEMRAWLRELVKDDGAPPPPEPPAPAPPAPPGPPPAPEPPAPEGKRTRPGRLQGAAYDWDVDEDGRVVRLGVARVYNGASEPDEVDLPDDDDPGAE